MSSPTLKNMYYKQESWFNYISLGYLGWFYRFLRPMAAILDFRTFMGQILIDFFWSFTISSRIENRWETFCYIFFGVRWYIDPSIRSDGMMLRRCLWTIRFRSISQNLLVFKFYTQHLWGGGGSSCAFIYELSSCPIRSIRPSDHWSDLDNRCALHMYEREGCEQHEYSS